MSVFRVYLKVNRLFSPVRTVPTVATPSRGTKIFLFSAFSFSIILTEGVEELRKIMEKEKAEKISANQFSGIPGRAELSRSNEEEDDNLPCDGVLHIIEGIV